MRTGHGADQAGDFFRSELDTVATVSKDHLTLRLIRWIAWEPGRVPCSSNPPANAQGLADADRIDAAVGGQRQCVPGTS
jgi:hypothetical protein